MHLRGFRKRLEEGGEIIPDVPGRRGWLLERGAVGRLRAAVERLLADPGTLAQAVRLLLDRHPRRR
jgi:putative restriction endonuclease